MQFILSIIIGAVLLLGGAPAAAAETVVSEAHELLFMPVSLQREQRLLAIVTQISQKTPSEDEKALLSKLKDRPPQLYIRHEEGPALIPRLDVGAAARFAQRWHQRRDAEKLGTEMLLAADPRLLMLYFNGTEAEKLGLCEAIAKASPDQVYFFRDAVLQASSRSGGPRLATAVGIKIADSQLLRSVISHGQSKDVQNLIALLSTVEPALQLPILEVALMRRDVASLALFAIGKLDNKNAEDRIWSALGDQQLGATAAAVLARKTDRLNLQRLIDLLEAPGKGPIKARAALALSLSGNPEAVTLAKQWAAKQ